MLEDKIAVTIDKSHLATLGERLYVEAVELFRELISNAYDADASEVYVRLEKDTIVVEDDGSGMDMRGLKQFFNIGSPEKRGHSVSPRHGRKRIGQFGIGKFAVLTAADSFIVESRKGDFIYQVSFDKHAWEQSGSWELPVRKAPATALHHEGTKVTLTQLRRTFTAAEVEKYLRAVLPLRAKKFDVFLNGKRVTPEEVLGRHNHFVHKTLYGEIEGDIVIAHDQKDVAEPGLECRVHGVLVKRSLFGVDPRRHGMQRICGWVEADFLPFTSSRTEFVKDHEAYKLFEQIVRQELERVVETVKQEVDKRELEKLQGALKDVLEKLKQALKENPDLMPSTRVLARRKKDQKKKPNESLTSTRVYVPREEARKEVSAEQENIKAGQDQVLPPEAPSTELPPATYERRFRVAKLGVTCGFAHLGDTGPEVISEGNIIYLNQDHPLYCKLMSKKEIFTLHLLRLITQEVVLMKKLRVNAREAFGLQSRLLRDALT